MQQETQLFTCSDVQQLRCMRSLAVCESTSFRIHNVFFFISPVCLLRRLFLWRKKKRKQTKRVNLYFAFFLLDFAYLASQLFFFSLTFCSLSNE